MTQHRMLVWVLIATLGGCAAKTVAPPTQPPANDADFGLHAAIIGSWIVPYDSSDYAAIPSREEFRADGSYSTYFFDGPACGRVIGQAEATWKIEDGVLVSTLTRASAPEIGSPGTVTRDQIVSVDARIMKLHSLDDDSTYTRVRSVGCFSSRPNIY